MALSMVQLIVPMSSMASGCTSTTLATRSTTNPSGCPRSITTARELSSLGRSGKPKIRARLMIGNTRPRRFARPSSAGGASGTRTISGTRMISCTGAISTANTSLPTMKVTNSRPLDTWSCSASTASPAGGDACEES